MEKKKGKMENTTKRVTQRGCQEGVPGRVWERKAKWGREDISFGDKMYLEKNERSSLSSSQVTHANSLGGVCVFWGRVGWVLHSGCFCPVYLNHLNLWGCFVSSFTFMFKATRTHTRARLTDALLSALYSHFLPVSLFLLYPHTRTPSSLTGHFTAI